MIEIIHSVIIGIVQGIAEFLPISSSAHLVLIPYIFHWQYNGLTFDVALHLGTVIAILVFFFKDWLTIITQAFGNKKSDSSAKDSDYPRNFLWQIIIASIPAAIVGYLIQNKVEAYFHSPLLIAINLAVFGIILWLADKYSKTDKKIVSVNYKQSFIVGFAQCLALIPGVSRSGITMVASRGIGFDREKAAKFSFLLGTPAMVGAFLLEIRKVSFASLDLAFWLGILASAIAGFFAIKYLLNMLKRADFSIFFWYRLLIAAIVVIIFSLR